MIYFLIMAIISNKFVTLCHTLFGSCDNCLKLEWILSLVANGTLPGRKYICSRLKSKVSTLEFRLNFWFVIESIAYEN